MSDSNDVFDNGYDNDENCVYVLVSISFPTTTQYTIIIIIVVIIM